MLSRLGTASIPTFRGLRCTILIPSFRAKSAVVSATQLVYSEVGDPPKVVSLKRVELHAPGRGQVLVKVLASPINPSDINMIQGVYAIKPPLPAVGGNECVAEVLEVGPAVQNLRVGDWAIAARAGVGCWTSHLVSDESNWVRIPRIDVVSAATLRVNPPTAYRMLHDFVQNFEPGDTVVQNGANSAVGRAVIQIAREMGLRTMNIVRDRPDIEQLRKDLHTLGASVVLTEDELRTATGKEAQKKLKPPRLALNCVGGKGTLFLAALLASKGKLVTYGGMSKQPLQLPVGPLIFKDISAHGFWMSHWYTIPEHAPMERAMYDYLIGLIQAGKLVPPEFEKVTVKDFQAALTKAVAGTGKKQLLCFH